MKCPICNQPVSWIPWWTEDRRDIVIVKCNSCKKLWKVDDSKGQAEETWKAIVEGSV